MPRHENVLSELNNQVWMILPDKLEAISGLVQKIGMGEVANAQASYAEARDRLSASMEGMTPTQRLYFESGVEMRGPVAVVPVRDTMMKRMSMMASFSGGTSTEMLSATLKALDADPNVRAVVLDVDSPGGSALGLKELSDTIRGMKVRTAAVANDVMASAAYFVGSAADNVYATEDSVVGSIGTIMKRWDFSAAQNAAGVKEHIWRSGPYKALGASSEPLTERETEDAQAMVDSFYQSFVSTVKENRNLSDEQATTISDGRVFIGAEAVTNNLVDAIKTVDQTVADLAADISAEDSATQAWETARSWETQANTTAAALEAMTAERDALANSAADAKRTAAAERADAYIGQLVDSGRVSASVSDKESAGHKTLHAKLMADFEGTKGLYDLVPAGAAAPGAMGAEDAPNTDADLTAQIAEARSKGIPVAEDKYAAEVFEETGTEYVKGYIA